MWPAAIYSKSRGTVYSRDSIVPASLKYEVTRTDAGLVESLVGDQEVEIGSQVVIFGPLQRPQKGSF